MEIPAVSPEQYARVQKNCSLAAQMGFAWWLASHPDADRGGVEDEVLRLVARFGRVSAKFACVYYMAQRRALGVDDGWRILPSDGDPAARIRRRISASYDPAKPLRGVRWVIDLAVKSYGRRTLERRRGVRDDR